MDSVSCTMDSAHKFTCEVQLDSDFDTAEPVASPPTAPPAAAAPPPQSDAAVSKLVSSFGSKSVPPPPSPPLLSGATLKECASSELGIAVAAAAGVKHPVLAALVMLKAGLDTGMCIAQSHRQAVMHSAEDYCREQGGTVLSTSTDYVTCERSAASQ